MDAEQIERGEILIARVIDGEATDAEFDELRSLAAVESSVWRDLAEAQRDAAGLSSAVDRAVSIADRVDLPVDTTLPVVRMRSVMSAGGWLAAASVLFAWIVTGGPELTEAPALRIPQHVAGLAPASAADALDRYLTLGREEGQVLGEMPTGVVLERRPLADGDGYEVIYLRQIMERAFVEDVYEIARDDAGKPETIRVDPRGPSSAH